MIWKIPPSCPEVEVSSQGDVRRLRDGRVYKPVVKSPRGIAYLVLRVTRGNRRAHFFVHRLVCEAFHGPAPTGKHGACHINGDSLCNVRSNLYWGTQQENIDDRERHGRTMRGDSHYAAKLTANMIPLIRKRIANGESLVMIAVRYGVSHYAIHDIKRGKSWRTA